MAGGRDGEAEGPRAGVGRSGGGGGSVGAAQSRTRTSSKQTWVSPQLAFLSRSGLGCGGCRALRESFPHRASLPFPQPPPFPRSAQWSQWRRVRRTSLRSLGSGLGHRPTLDFRRSGRSAWCSSRGSPNVSISAVLVVYSRSVAVGYSHISGTHIVTRHVQSGVVSIQNTAIAVLLCRLSPAPVPSPCCR